MTTTKTAFEPFLVHFLDTMTITVSASIHGCGRTVEHGQEMLITPAIRKVNTDRVGNCWVDLIDDEPRQIQRWSKVIVRRGPWPEGQPRWEHGSLAWDDAYEAARAEAWKIEDAAARSARLAAVRAEFNPPATSRTIGTYPGDADA